MKQKCSPVEFFSAVKISYFLHYLELFGSELIYTMGGVANFKIINSRPFLSIYYDQ